MARSPREHLPGIFEHIIARGNRRQAIFEEEEDWLRLAMALRQAAVSGDLDLCAYCLMPNHLHLLIRCPKEPMHKGLHPILTSHAVYMNKKYGRSGHLFQDRFKDYACIDEGARRRVIRYIHENPIRGGLVKRADDWKWSSHLDFMGKRPEDPFPVETGLSFFGGNLADARKTYEAFMNEAPEPCQRDGSGRFPLDALASRAERVGGHQKGFLKGHTKNRVAAKLRARFIVDALASGYRPHEIAAYLGMAKSVVNWARNRA